MTPRERVVAALKREVPDRVPRQIELCEEKIAELGDRTGRTDPEEYFDQEMRWSRTRYYEPSQTMEARAARLESQESDLCGVRIDEWGVGYLSSGEHHFQRQVHPLAGEGLTVRDVADYPFPSLRQGITAELTGRCAGLHEKGYAAISHICPVGGIALGSLQTLRGMQQTMLDIALSPEIVEALLDRLLDCTLQLTDEVVASGCDVVYIGDDYAMQQGLLFSKDVFDRFFRPHIEKVVDHCKKVNPDVIVAHHCDGDCRQIIRDFIEIGVDVLNPVQPECMDVQEVKREFGRDIALWGTMGTQQVLPFGTPEQVEEEVRRIMEIAGEDGGFMIAPSHMIEPEVPWENLEALMSAVEKYGRY